ncbi:hypothetical protein FA09DRAFT_332706 [Tilletiopsis washingtonensis]|uniref:RRM domain-containing protein n=1 Tax=Tilletiopsis washingtonensis TaxID=58919 RepID=A0A316YZC6_9BASI|nr:hypothetical protein FA09DRAFT_332706 [Tilletiopsis washingtonensis]PWN94800.1 hypothetical protein FA09DRAFT_332706 [Tilletiopsis washingtonensis]
MGKRSSLPSSSAAPPAAAEASPALDDAAAAQKKADKAARKAAKAAASASATAAPAAPAAARPPTFDAALDAIFSSAGAAPAALSLPSLAAPRAETAAEKPKKSSKRKLEAAPVAAAAAAVADSEATTSTPQQQQSGSASKRAKRGKGAVAERAGASSSTASTPDAPAPAAEGEAPVFSDSEDDDDAAPPVHETVLAARASAARHAPAQDGGPSQADAARAERDGRSIFLGNVPISVLSSKSQRRALVRHVLLHSPWPSLTKLSALRFRSVPFSVPTGDYAAATAAEAAASEKRRNRTRDWKAKQAGEEGKSWLTPAQKRKVAFINANINEQAHSLNAYVSVHAPTVAMQQTFAQQHGASEQSTALLQAPVLAAFIASNVDGSAFRGRHLRADVCAALSASLRASAGLNASLPSGQLLGAPRSDDIDAPNSVFVGNLDFAADEEKLWDWCERTLQKEQGVPPEWEEVEVGKYGKLPAAEKRGESEKQAATREEMDELDRDEIDDDEEEAQESDAEADDAALADAKEGQAAARPARLFPAPAPREASFLRAIRFVRDPATQMGKGFGYMRFATPASVDEMLALAASDEAVLAARKKGGAAAKNAAASQAAATGETQFRRKMKFDGRPLRVSRCKKQRPKPASSSAHGARGDKIKSTAPPAALSTPNKRARSSGAPSPGGSSPSTRREARSQAGRNGAFARGGAARSTGAAAAAAAGPPVIKATATKASAASSTAQAAAKTPNPPPQAPRDAAKEARLAAKRADPERAAKRASKKARKVVEARAVRKMGGKEALLGKVRLEQKKKSRPGEAKKGGAPKGKAKVMGGKRP